MPICLSAENARNIAKNAGTEYIRKYYGVILAYTYNKIQLVAARGDYTTSINLLTEYPGIPQCVRDELVGMLIGSLRSQGYRAVESEHFPCVLIVSWKYQNDSE